MRYKLLSPNPTTAYNYPPIPQLRIITRTAPLSPQPTTRHLAAQDFVARRVTLNGAECKLLHRQARAVPLNVSATLPGTAGARPEAAEPPKFTYAPFVDASGKPAPTELTLPKLPGASDKAAAEAEQAVSILNGGLIGVDGQPLALKGVNWCAACRARPPAWGVREQVATGMW